MDAKEEVQLVNNLEAKLAAPCGRGFDPAFIGNIRVVTGRVIVPTGVEVAWWCVSWCACTNPHRGLGGVVACGFA